MKIIQAIIIDDEVDALEALKYEVEHYCQQVEVIKVFSDPKEALNYLNSNKIDLVFLDIEMPGLNGFELLEKIQNISFDVIFITAYDQFAVKAFEFNATDYILKPVQKEKLIYAVEKVINKKTESFDKSSLAALVTNIYSQTSAQSKNIALPTSEGYSFVSIDDIIYVKAESNYCWVFIKNGDKFLLSKTLKSLEMMLTGNQFVRVHQSFVINLDYAEKYVKGQGGYLIMKNSEQIPVSRARREVLIEILKSGF